MVFVKQITDTSDFQVKGKNNGNSLLFTLISLKYLSFYKF